jgi:hypothetical protein
MNYQLANIHKIIELMSFARYVSIVIAIISIPASAYSVSVIFLFIAVFAHRASLNTCGFRVGAKTFANPTDYNAIPKWLVAGYQKTLSNDRITELQGINKDIVEHFIRPIVVAGRPLTDYDYFNAIYADMLYISGEDLEKERERALNKLK